MWRILMFLCVFSGITCIFAEVIFNIIAHEENSMSCEQTLENPAKAVVLESEELMLRVNYPAIINYFQCVGKNNPSNIFVKNKENSPRYSVTSIKATTVMTGLWVCTIYTNMDVGIEPYKYIKELKGKFTELICHVHVHVRVSNTPQKVLVNNLTIPTSRVNNIEEDFDHSAEYHYLNGDIVTVKCIPVFDIVTSTIEFNYDFAENLDNMFKEVMKNKRAQLFGFHTKLQAQHDKSVMICKYHGENDHTTIKVTFILKQTIENTGYIMVNGLIVRPHYSINGLNSEIDYFSFDGENVEIVCSSSSGLETADNENCNPGGQTFTQSLIAPFVYNCFLCKAKRGIKHIKVSSQKLDSYFKERTRLHVDLPSNNIIIELFKYEEDIRYSWIYYEFEEGEHIVPKCTEYKDKDATSVLEVRYYLNEKEQERNEQVKLTSGYENNVFICEVREAASQPPLIYKQIKVLFRKKPLTTTTTTTTTTSTTNSMEVIFNITVHKDNSISCEQTLENPAKAVILESEELMLRVNYPLHINYFQCVGKNNQSYIFVKNKEDSPRYSVTSIKATTVMSGLWVCTIYTNKDVDIKPTKYIKELKGTFTELICHVHVHVRVLNTPQKVLINNLTIPTSRVNNIEEDLDHSAEYHYLNGDILTVKCIPVIDIVTSTIEFNYDSAANLHNRFKKEMKNKRAKLFGFQTKLQAQHDKSVIICKYHGENDHTTIKVTFILKQTIESIGPDLTVNGLIVRPHYTYDGLNSEIDYFSFDGETVEIVCSSSSGLETADNKNCHPGAQTFTQSLTTPFDYNCFLCKDKRVIKHIKVSSQRLDSYFNERLRLHVDLPSTNILLELFKYEEMTRYTWIYYEFGDGEHLQPKCTLPKNTIANAIMEVKYYLNNKEHKENEQVKLTSGYDKNVFECVLMEKRISDNKIPIIYRRLIVLFGKKPVPIGPDDSSNSNVIVIISCSVAVLVCIFGITIVCSLCKKRTDTGDTQNATSSNQHQSRPLPEIPERQPLDNYDYVYSSIDHVNLQPDETRNETPSLQNTIYYWANQ